MTDTSKRDAELERRLAAANERIKSLEQERDLLQDRLGDQKAISFGLENERDRLRLSASRLRDLEHECELRREAYELAAETIRALEEDRDTLRSLLEEVVFFAHVCPPDWLTRVEEALGPGAWSPEEDA